MLDSSPINQQLRIKFYKLNNLSTWDDNGTGFITLKRIENNQMLLIITAENTGKVILNHNVILDAAISPYNRQNDTILAWSQEGEGDYALSFENLSGLLIIWREIMTAQGRSEQEILTCLAADYDIEDNLDSNNNDMGPVLLADHNDQLNNSFESIVPFTIPDMWKIPFPSENNLNVINEKLAAALTTCEKKISMENEIGEGKETLKEFGMVDPLDARDTFPLDCMISQVLNENYISQLYSLHSIFYDLSAAEELASFYHIFISLIRLNSPNVMEILLSDENIEKTIICLEQDPEGEGSKHKKFLEESKLIQVIPFKNTELAIRIQQTFRLSYLTNHILIGKLEEQTHNNLGHLIYFNNVWIVSTLIEDLTFFPSLFSLMLRTGARVDPQLNRLAHCFQFFNELTTICKTLPMPQRSMFYNTLLKAGLLPVIHILLNSNPDETLLLILSDTLLSLNTMDSGFLKSYILECERQKDTKIGDTLVKLPELSILTIFINYLTGEKPSEQFLIHLFADIIKGTFEFEIINLQHPQPPSKLTISEKSSLLSTLFETHLIKIVGCLERKSSFGNDWHCKYHCIELLFSLVTEHSQRLKPYFMRWRIFEVLGSMLSTSKKSQVILSAIRFLRLIISLEDEYYIKRIILLHALRPVMILLFENGSKYNMLNSTILQLLDVIRNKNIKTLLEWLIDEFGTKFKETNYVPLFDQMIKRHEQNVAYGSEDQVPLSKVVENEAEAAYFESSAEIEEVKDEIIKTDAEALNAIDILFNRSKQHIEEEDDLIAIVSKRKANHITESPDPTRNNQPIKRKSNLIELPTIKPHQSSLLPEYEDDELDNKKLKTNR